MTQGSRHWLDRIVVREAARERRSRLTWLARLARPLAVTRIDVPGREQSDPSAGRFPEHLALRQAFELLRPPHRAAVVLIHFTRRVGPLVKPIGVSSRAHPGLVQGVVGDTGFEPVTSRM